LGTINGLYAKKFDAAIAARGPDFCGTNATDLLHQGSTGPCVAYSHHFFGHKTVLDNKSLEKFMV
jgi:hypothetical protein